MAPVRALRMKLRPPPPRSDHVTRPALVRRLADLGPGRWALLSAPLGYGKTALAAELARSAPTPVAWIAVDARDDFRRFCVHVLAALANAGVSGGDEARLAVDHGGGDEDLASALSNDLGSLEQECLVVIDGLDAAASPLVESFVADLAAHAPEEVRLVVATRTEPTRALHTMRARGLLVELRGADLAFDADAAARYFSARSISMADPAIARVLDVTGGWPLAVQLVATAVARGAPLDRSLSGLAGHADLLAALAAEVLDTFEPPLRRAVLDLAPLEVLSAPLVEHLLPATDGDALLSDLDALNAFVSAIDDTRVAYAVHPIWSAFICERAKRERGADAPRSTLVRAADFYAQSGHLAEAIDHALAASDYERASQWIESIAFGLLAQGDGESVLAWLDALDRGSQTGAMEAGLTPALSAARAWALVLSLRWREADALAAAMRGSVDRTRHENAFGHASAVRAAVAFAAGDTERGEVFASEALASLNDADPAALAVRGDRGLARARSGDLRAARSDLQSAAGVKNVVGRSAAWHLAELDLIERGLEAGRRGHEAAFARDPVPEHPSRAALAELARESDAVDMARASLDAYLDDARRRGSTYALAMGLVGRARVGTSEGRHDLACELLAEAAVLVERTGLPDGSIILQVLRALSGLRSAVAFGAVDMLEDADVAIAAALGHGGGVGVHALTANLPPEVVALAAARIELAWAVTGPAVERLGELRERAAREGRMRSVIEADLVRAIARGETVDARAELDAAVGRARAFGLARLANDDAALFDHVATGRARSWARQRALGVLGSAGPRIPRPADALSRREIEVLSWIATGLSTSAAARQLHVSQATVKKHLENIFERLGVRGRMEAVAKARSLGVLR